jgi:hypothetical protein
MPPVEMRATPSTPKWSWRVGSRLCRPGNVGVAVCPEKIETADGCWIKGQTRCFLFCHPERSESASADEGPSLTGTRVLLFAISWTERGTPERKRSRLPVFRPSASIEGRWLTPAASCPSSSMRHRAGASVRQAIQPFLFVLERDAPLAMIGADMQHINAVEIVLRPVRHLMRVAAQ